VTREYSNLPDKSPLLVQATALFDEILRSLPASFEGFVMPAVTRVEFPATGKSITAAAHDLFQQRRDALRFDRAGLGKIDALQFGGKTRYGLYHLFSPSRSRPGRPHDLFQQRRDALRFDRARFLQADAFQFVTKRRYGPFLRFLRVVAPWRPHDLFQQLAERLARPLDPDLRGPYLHAVVLELQRYKPEQRGPGLVHRIGREMQREFLHAPETKHGR
jgi:hypothetical protein